MHYLGQNDEYEAQKFLFFGLKDVTFLCINSITLGLEFWWWSWNYYCPWWSFDDENSQSHSHVYCSGRASKNVEPGELCFNVSTFSVMIMIQGLHSVYANGVNHVSWFFNDPYYEWLLIQGLFHIFPTRFLTCMGSLCVPPQRQSCQQILGATTNRSRGVGSVILWCSPTGIILVAAFTWCYV